MGKKEKNQEKKKKKLESSPTLICHSCQKGLGVLLFKRSPFWGPKCKPGQGLFCFVHLFCFCLFVFFQILQLLLLLLLPPIIMIMIMIIIIFFTIWNCWVYRTIYPLEKESISHLWKYSCELDVRIILHRGGTL